jgi:hypothetical protein
MEPIKIGKLTLQPWQVGAGSIVAIAGIVAYFKSTSVAEVVTPPTSSSSPALAASNLAGAGGSSVGTMETISLLNDELNSSKQDIADMESKYKQELADTEADYKEQISELTSSSNQAINDISNKFNDYQTNTNAQISTVAQNFNSLAQAFAQAPVAPVAAHPTSPTIPTTSSTPVVVDYSVAYNNARAAGDTAGMTSANIAANIQRGLGAVVNATKDIEYIAKIGAPK